MSCSSASVGFWPSDLMTVPSSLVVIVPSPSLSNKEKASLNSAGSGGKSEEVRLLLLCGYRNGLRWDTAVGPRRSIDSCERCDYRGPG